MTLKIRRIAIYSGSNLKGPEENYEDRKKITRTGENPGKFGPKSDGRIAKVSPAILSLFGELSFQNSGSGGQVSPEHVNAVRHLLFI